MASSSRVINALNESTSDSDGPVSFGRGPVQVSATNSGSFVGTIALQRRFTVGESKTAWETIRSWTQTDMPVQQEYESVSMNDWRLICLAYTSGACQVAIGN